ncbi:MAG: NAD(P)/FAD-dependent oxidoreductase [Microscillaceae bacterium]|nr:NAD(P)/FAD-dependent oxidoreductase [Microscillaceae bacterium]
MNSLKIAVIGGGAAGFFAAITCAEHYPQHQVFLLEKSSKLLSKVKISGGGRCNVTHACFNAVQLAQHYPRGDKFLKNAFKRFMPQDMIAWLKQRDILVKAEADGRMFPVSDDSQTIIDCFLSECQLRNIFIHTRHEVSLIQKKHEGAFLLKITGKPDMEVNRVIIASGGSPRESGLSWLKELGHNIEPPVPSLFSFNIRDENLTELMGVSVASVSLKVQSTKLQESGPIIITHWGLSGPAILKLSAWGARILKSMDYNFALHVNWMGDMNEDRVRAQVQNQKSTHPAKKIKNECFDFSKRLWTYFMDKAKIPTEKIWGELSKADINRLVALLSNDVYQVEGKTTFKEEFVTCGGVGLGDIDVLTMQSKKIPHLYFCGEVMDIDGITGGFNFQAAWTTAYIAGVSAGML